MKFDYSWGAIILSGFPIFYNSIRIIPGKGIYAIVGAHNIQIGNLPLMKDCKVNISDYVMNRLEKIHNSGDTIIIIAINNHPAGIITLADKLRNSTRNIIKVINNFNKANTIITGFNIVIQFPLQFKVNPDNNLNTDFAFYLR